MPKIAVNNLAGKKVADLELSEDVFGLSQNFDLLHQVYVSIAANKRTVISHTKDRGERTGSGRKPWKQKGTGNARVGSVRTPIWRKGGIVFGPTKERNFKKKINKKVNQKAILLALSEKVRENQFLVVDEIKLKEKKTKEFFQALRNLKVEGSTLIGFSDTEKDFRLASKNIKNTNNILTSRLNVFDILNHKNLLLSQDSIKYLEEKYSNK